MARPQVLYGGMVSNYGGQMLIHGISSSEQMTMGDPPAWGLGEVLTTTQH
jgi:hypothetical protein